MMHWMLMTLLLIFNLIFMNMKHPLAMGLTLLIQTTLICLISGFLSKSFWYSYILFLVFLGGMLVLFIYVTSLASNEMFKFSMKLSLIALNLFIISMMYFYMMDKNSMIPYMNTEMNPINFMTSYISENTLSLNKLYNQPINMLTILLMNYLLITLIAIVKISKLFKGPLRPMFN